MAVAGTPALLGQGGCPIGPGRPYVFSEGNWTGWDLTGFTSGTGGSSSGLLIASGGNPGAFRRVEISVNAGSSSDPPAFWGVHSKSGVSYDPRINGPISSIDYCED